MKISFSKAKTWRRCHNKYHYKYNLGLRKKKKAIQLFRGSIIGDCLDAIVEGNFEDVLAQYQKKYNRLLKAEKDYYGDVIGDVRNIMQRYLKKYGQDLEYEYYCDHETGKPYELKVEADLGDNIQFIGYIDKMIHYKGRNWILDHKSHKKIPDDNDRLVNMQLIFYMWGAPMGGYPRAHGVIWDYIRTKLPTVPAVLKSGELSQSKKIDTDRDTYYQAIVDNDLDPNDYKDILKSLEGNEARFFKRVVLPSPSEATISILIDDLRDTAKAIRYTSDCDRVRSFDYTCPGTCDYFELCVSEFRGGDSEFIIKSDFEVKETRDGSETQESSSEETE